MQLPPRESDWDTECNPSFRMHLESLIEGRRAVTLHFQPIVDLARGVAAGYETLARFPSVMGPAPDLCFEAAGRINLRMELEEVVVRSALLSKALLPPDCFLSVNMSPGFLVSAHWQRVLSGVTGLGGIVIEITEEESITDYATVRTKLAQIRALGGCIAVDDAGSGFASLKHIVEMKPAFIKLDRTFISGCNNDPAKSALIEMMGRAANRLDAWIIAEGIETEPELNELIQLGVPLGQGYFLGKPDALMHPVAAPKTSAIVARVQAHNGSDRLTRHIEPCATRPTREAARELLLSPSQQTVVVLDKWNRPTQLLDRHPILGVQETMELMKIQAQTSPEEVLLRALTRPAATRFDPFVVIDEQGAFQGVVRIDRLMRGLIEAAPREA